MITLITTALGSLAYGFSKIKRKGKAQASPIKPEHKEIFKPLI